MKGKARFSAGEAALIRQLLRQRVGLPREQQKQVRDGLRAVGFYISDWDIGLTPEGFDRLVREGRIAVVEGPAPSASPAGTTRGGASGGSDEDYVIDLCDQVLGQSALRQHCFDFLHGDPGKSGTGAKLPVDAYYESLRLVIEYEERQHMQEVPFFDRRQTVSGVSRGEQRQIYDQRRREVLPQQGIALVEFSFDDFAHDRRRRLLRRYADDLAVVRKRLARWGQPSPAPRKKGQL
jgi:hypothetical protein